MKNKGFLNEYLHSTYSDRALGWAAATKLLPTDGDPSEEVVANAVSQFEETVDNWTRVWNADSNLRAGISIKNALTTTDVGFIFDEVTQRVLEEPKQPNLFLQNVVAERVDFGLETLTQTVEFYSVGNMEAGEVGQDGEYPSSQASFNKNRDSFFIRKWGIRTALTEEVMAAASSWNIVAIYLRLMKQAVDRQVENELYSTMEGAAVVVFDNENADTLYHTTGKASDQTANYTLSFYDIVKMYGVMMNNGYTATHVLGHPLGWAAFYYDPFMRAAFVNGGQIGGNIWNQPPNQDQSANMPFGVAYVPYYAINHEVYDTLSGAGSGEAATFITDLYMIDKDNSLNLLTRGDVMMDEKFDWGHDASMFKVRRYAGAAAKDAGWGMTRAKRLRMDRNDEAVATIRTTS